MPALTPKDAISHPTKTMTSWLSAPRGLLDEERSLAYRIRAKAPRFCDLLVDQHGWQELRQEQKPVRFTQSPGEPVLI